MKYTDYILNHPEFIRIQKKISELETDRIYCHHELAHALDVARMAWIYYLEDFCASEKSLSDRDQLESRRDIVYVCALLHDIGRAAQYETGIHHSLSGVKAARAILSDIGFPQDQAEIVLSVISDHHTAECGGGLTDWGLEKYIHRADHDCRLCFLCQAADTCKWSEQARNNTIVC